MKFGKIGRVLSFLACLCLSSTLARAQGGGDQATLKLTPCDVRGVEGKAKCGTFEVFENRNSRKGRRINLQVLVLPATGPNRLPDPLFYLAGGPGSSATEAGPYIAGLFLKVRETRDLVFVDQRGTGGSHPLNCDLFDPKNPQSYLGSFLPVDDVRKCRAELEPNADLELYTTSIAADDLDEVREALGYEKINLFGVSYGSRAALVYLKRYGKHVRTAMLQGVSPSNHFMPYEFPQSNERALQGVIAECAADEKCNAAFPNLREESKAVLERLLRGPVEVEIELPDTAGETNGQVDAAARQAIKPVRTKLSLSRDLAAEAIRYMLYSPVPASRVPLILHRAALGNFGPLASAALSYRQQIVATGSNGMYLSITCAEDLPWIKPGEGERLAANTFLGDYRLRQQREACSIWPRGTIPADYSQPTRSTTPILILTGEWDPVTPPSNGDTVARYLPNSLHVVVPHGAHGLSGLEGVKCVVGLMNEFVERGTAKELDTSCVRQVRRKGWAVEWNQKEDGGR